MSRILRGLPAIALLTSGGVCLAQQPNRVNLERLENGTTVAFVRSDSGVWGIEVSNAGSASLRQEKPARIEIYGSNGEIRQLAAGYQRIEKTAAGVAAQAEVAGASNVKFLVKDAWSVKGSVLSLRKSVQASGSEEGSGLYSAIMLSTSPAVSWPDLDFLAPGLLYGDPTYDGLASPGGMLNYRARRFLIREDFLPAPLFAVSFRNGRSVTVLDPAPRGQTTLVESKAPAGQVMIDEKFQFGALGAAETPGGVEIGFWLPGSVNENTGRRGEPPVPSWRRRYHPIRHGFTQSYQVEFRIGQNESFPELTRNAWRWAWHTLKPSLNYHDIEVVRRGLIDPVGAQGITAQVAGHVDQYLDWAVATYVKLYKYTRDPHYLDIARLLLHNSKAMTALPGRLYGMFGPGWQQENWRMGPSREGRGFGTPEKWMPWVTTNHLYGIAMLEETDPVLFRQLCANPAASPGRTN